MKFVDSHCHPQFPQYDGDREDVIKRALSAGVQIICVGTDRQMSVAAIELANKYDGVWASVGLHPNEVNFQFSISNFQLLADSPKVVAIGEVGLDYYRTKEPEKQKLQKEVFEQFVDLAAKTNKPLIIHCRDAAPNFSDENLGGQAHKDMIELLEARSQELGAKGVIHSFTGTWDEAKKYIDLGFYIGLNGIITFTPKSPKAIGGPTAEGGIGLPLLETIINIPLDHLLLETDAPYLAPVPHRGKRNEPSYVKYVAEKIAELKKVSLDEVAVKTTQNTRNLFKV